MAPTAGAKCRFKENQYMMCVKPTKMGFDAVLKRFCDQALWRQVYPEVLTHHQHLQQKGPGVNLFQDLSLLICKMGTKGGTHTSDLLLGLIYFWLCNPPKYNVIRRSRLNQQPAEVSDLRPCHRNLAVLMG